MDNLFKLTNTIVDSKLIISDGIFSMTGEIAKIPQLTELSRKTNSLLIIDDTHGVGVFGKHGSGTCSHFSLTQNDVHLITASLGKAFGNYGAMVCGSQLMIEYLEQFARTSMFSTATPAALAAAGIKAIEIIQEETWRREKLHHLISFFNMTAYELSLPILKSISPIQIIPIADNKKVLKISDHLKTVGYTVAAIRAPTVPPNHTCLRITLTCLHNENQIVDLLKIIKNELVSS